MTHPSFTNPLEQWIGLTPNNGDSAYLNGPLPTTNTTSPTAIIPFWDDLLIVNGAGINPQSNLTQRIVHATQGTAPNRAFTIEWVASKFSDPLQHYRFWVTFFEVAPGGVRFTYWDISDGGASATVGAQNLEGEFG